MLELVDRILTVLEDEGRDTSDWRRELALLAAESLTHFGGKVDE